MTKSVTVTCVESIVSALLALKRFIKNTNKEASRLYAELLLCVCWLLSTYK